MFDSLEVNSREKNYSMAIPYVGAIIERENNGILEVLIQTRWKLHSDPVYTGTFEFDAIVKAVRMNI